MDYAVITPYIVPVEIQSKKTVNIGDGFILNNLIKLLHPAECKYLFTSRKELSENDIDKINSTKALILAGANQLNDNFTIVPGMSLGTLAKIKVPVVPFGIGIHGISKQNLGMSNTTKEILTAIHQRISFSSWRCPLTIQYLNNSLPEIVDKFLLTGCPVIYDDKILHNSRFNHQAKTVVVTVTDRQDFWDRETKTIDFVAHKYKKSRKVLSLHQDFLGIQSNLQTNQYTILNTWKIKFLKKYDGTPFSLRNYARNQGFEIFKPTSVNECLSFYNKCDLHIGSRVHAHLYFLSQAKKSFLTYVDERCVGFSKLLEFPICNYNNLSEYLNYDFEIYRQNCINYFSNMQKFVDYLQEEVL
ncbi:polysaccharide pyruvyl transferase family protein [Nostoc edaphicum CCNP1411]|uniref:Polysaccharide pyruvyl transferase family protein n=1 Tax=Nostoc edaphicum CCNP1411 TaxID=1472755 RepID=A0A7D7LF80_9NOSO|nr:polysaccharide pyruvyl transferase family protein [Nostoc edaphicum]QMS90668.1 polysaccharide pyruvyl transferase family protein [Nostoc edaphicum CCNP1411]